MITVRPTSACLLALSMAGFVTACIKPPPVTPVAAKSRPVEKPKVQAKGIVSTISLTSLFALQQSDRVLVYDARPGFVHAFGHLPGAVNWPRGLFDSERPQHESEIKTAIAADRTIVIYCTDAACPDAGAVAQRIAKLGYSVSVLDGGYAAWKEAGLPTE